MGLFRKRTSPDSQDGLGTDPWANPSCSLDRQSLIGLFQARFTMTFFWRGAGPVDELAAAVSRLSPGVSGRLEAPGILKLSHPLLDVCAAFLSGPGGSAFVLVMARNSREQMEAAEEPFTELIEPLVGPSGLDALGWEGGVFSVAGETAGASAGPLAGAELLAAMEVIPFEEIPQFAGVEPGP